MLNELAKEIHEIAVEHGWWDKDPSFGETIALCHSELSEALDERDTYRSCLDSANQTNAALAKKLTDMAYEQDSEALQEPEKALTLNELCEMDGEPVWCVDGTGGEYWCLVSAPPEDESVGAIDSECGELQGIYYGMTGSGTHGLAVNGWLAYRHKPEGLTK